MTQVVLEHQAIRPKPAHMPGILRCLQAYRFHVFGSADKVDPDFGKDEMLSVRNQICFVNLAERSWLVECEGKVLGVCCWDWIDREKGIAKTILISVLPEARRDGIGVLLQKARLREMRELGAREVHTWCDDPRAVLWYRVKFGYEQIGQERIRHCIHCLSLGDRACWGIHRGHVEHDTLAHLRLVF